MKLTKTNKKGFTLVEMVISVTIVAVLFFLAGTGFININTSQKRIRIQNALQEDARFMIDKISRLIASGTIDYEEYFNVNVLDSGNFGDSYGVYASEFYDLGSDNEVGHKCINTVTLEDGLEPPCDPTADPPIIVDRTTLDVNTGVNPSDNEAQSQNYNSVCENNVNCPEQNLQSVLYLINSTGDRKTLIGLEQIASNPDVFAVSMVEMDGIDTDGDSIVDIWTCADGYLCSDSFDVSYSRPLYDDLTDTNDNKYNDFIPISPSTINITNLQFFIDPLEDPYKAFGESEENIQKQPRITVVLTVQPHPDLIQRSFVTTPSVTLQSTVTSQINTDVSSF